MLWLQKCFCNGSTGLEADKSKDRGIPTSTLPVTGKDGGSALLHGEPNSCTNHELFVMSKIEEADEFNF